MLNICLRRKHVFSDLQPYICTFLNCPKEDELYGSQREWFDHEVQFHRREWYCDVCSESFLQKTSFQDHIRAEHSELVTEGDFGFTAVISRCERAIVNGIVCPLCGTELTFQALEKHLGLHLQEIALFALPRPVPDGGSIDSKSVKLGLTSECSSDYSSRKSSLDFGFGSDGKWSGDQPIPSSAGVRCICSYQHDDGFLIICSNCQQLQHGVCMSISETNVPEVYECSACISGVYDLDIEKAINIQEGFLRSVGHKAPESDIHIERPVQTQAAARSLEIAKTKHSDNNPLPDPRLALINVSHFEDWDIQHIEAMFNLVDPENNFRVEEGLCKRLGKANTKRRQLLKYYETYHKKISKHIDNDIPSSRRVIKGNKPTNATKNVAPTVAPTLESDSSKEIPELEEAATVEGAATECTWTKSVTSYATTINHKPGIHVPSPPDKDAFAGKPFECPYCFKITRIRSRQEWKYVGNYT